MQINERIVLHIISNLGCKIFVTVIPNNCVVVDSLRYVDSLSYCLLLLSDKYIREKVLSNCIF